MRQGSLDREQTNMLLNMLESGIVEDISLAATFLQNWDVKAENAAEITKIISIISGISIPVIDKAVFASHYQDSTDDMINLSDLQNTLRRVVNRLWKKKNIEPWDVAKEMYKLINKK